MKIKMFISSLRRSGGAQRVLVNLAKNLKTDHELEVVVSTLVGETYRDELEGVLITDLNFSNVKLGFFHLYRYVSQCEEFDAALVFGPEISVYLYFVKKLLHRKFTIVSRCLNTLSYEFQCAEGAFRKYVTGTVVKCFYKKTDMIIAQSEGMKQDMIKNYGVHEERTVVINNPLASEFEKEMLANKPVAMAERDEYILFVGRLEKQKGLEMLFKAFAGLEAQDLDLYLVGSGSKQQELTALVAEYGIADRVQFRGFTTGIIPYYKNAKMLALSSYHEGFPNVLIEALACGTPVVAYDLPSGPNEIIVDGINGYIAKYLDVGDLTRCMNRALQTDWDPAKIVQTGMRYRQDAIVARYRDVLEKAGARNRT